MIWVAIAVIGILVIVFSTKGKKEDECPECEEPEEECINCDEPVEPCAELKKLQVYYNGKALAKSEVVKVPYNTNVEFRVAGFDITGTKEACIEGADVTWDKSCPVTYWENPTGLINRVRVNNKTLKTQREVWVKHKTGITFAWKVEVI